MKRLMILSGAGLSAQSGISTFRESDGLWENYDVMEVCSAQGWRLDRDKVTRFYNARRKDLEDKVPNSAHKTLAALEKRYSVIHLTQNVDDLMERAGAKNLIHLHGTLRDLRCEACHKSFDIGYRAQKDQEQCPYCGAQSIRHNVVMFGESAPNYRYIYETIANSDIFIAIGTSGQVIDIVPIAKAFKHSILIDPKRQEYRTSFGSHEHYIDEVFSHFIQKTATEAMPELLELLDSI